MNASGNPGTLPPNPGLSRAHKDNSAGSQQHMGRVQPNTSKPQPPQHGGENPGYGKFADSGASARVAHS